MSDKLNGKHESWRSGMAQLYCAGYFSWYGWLGLIYWKLKQRCVGAPSGGSFWYELFFPKSSDTSFKPFIELSGHVYTRSKAVDCFSWLTNTAGDLAGQCKD